MPKSLNVQSLQRYGLSLMLMGTALISGGFLLSGCQYFQKSSLENSVPMNSTSVAHSPADKKAVQEAIKTGDAQAQAGKWQAAIGSFQKAVAMDAHQAQAHAQMGWAYAELKQWDDAEQHLQLAINLNP